MMKPMFRAFVLLPLWFCFFLTLKITLDLFNGSLLYSIKEIVLKYGLTIAVGELCGLILLFSRRILLNMKNRSTSRSSELSKWFRYTCITTISCGGCMCLIHILLSLVWYSVPIRIIIFIFSLAGGMLFGPLVYLLTKLLKKKNIISQNYRE